LKIKKNKSKMSNAKKMSVEIWSDIMCPFCYIGKRKFEQALSQFEGKDEVEIIWKSYQLSPQLVTDTSTNINEYLSVHKGITLEQAQQMNAQVSQMAKQVELEYNLDKSVVANSFDAHRFSHYALSKGKQGAAEEKLFQAYFTEGKNMDDKNILMDIGTEIGLDANEIEKILDSEMYRDAVIEDIKEAEAIGVQGVPFFVFDRKYAVSGAQDTAVFLNTLQQTLKEKQNTPIS
jgi:predicted DsbA family dithiol-disulfide isomerase